MDYYKIYKHTNHVYTLFLNQINRTEIIKRINLIILKTQHMITNTKLLKIFIKF